MSMAAGLCDVMSGSEVLGIQSEHRMAAAAPTVLYTSGGWLTHMLCGYVDINVARVAAASCTECVVDWHL